MPKTIYIFKLNDNFISLQNENNLLIILDTFLKAKTSDFYKEQFNLMVNKLDVKCIHNNIDNYFINKNNYYSNENSSILKNTFKNNDEKIYFYDNFIMLIYENENSIFLDYLSLYFVDLLAIDLEKEKIYPLYLVKGKTLV